MRADQTTVGRLTSEIVKKLGAKITRFDLELRPDGLGRVDVKVQIDAKGAMSASLRFDNPHAAAELKGRADELRGALQQAGFDVSDTGLSFDFSQGRRPWAQDAQEESLFAGRAFAAASDAAEDIDSTVTQASARLSGRSAGGFDIRI